MPITALPGQLDLFTPDPDPTMTSCLCTPPAVRPCGHCAHCDTCLDCNQCAGPGHDHDCEAET